MESPGGRDPGRGRGRKGGGGGGGRRKNPKGDAGAGCAPAGEVEVKKGGAAAPKHRRGGKGAGAGTGAGTGAGASAGAAPSSKRRQQEEDTTLAKNKKLQQEEEAAAAAAQAEAEAAARAAALALEKQRKEEEARKRKREEEEKAALEEEARLRQEEEIRQREEEQRRELRAANSPEAVAKSRAEHDQKKKQLKSDLKKTSTFTTKVKLMNESHRASLTKDIQTLNLTRYVSEIVDAVAEAKLKPSDVGVAVHVCCMMHQRYSDFTDDLIPKLFAPLRELDSSSFSSTGGWGEEEDKEAYRRRRVNLRLLTELHLCGVFDGTAPLVKLIRRYSGEGPRAKEVAAAAAAAARLGENDRKKGAAPIEACPPGLRSNDVSLVVAFAKQAGKSISETSEGNAYSAIIRSLFDRLCPHLEKSHRDLRRREKRFERDRLLCGSLSEEREAELEGSLRAYDRLVTNVKGLAELLGECAPALTDEKDEEEIGGVELWSGEAGSGDDHLGPWDDEDMRSFYEDLPDLLTCVLPSQLGLTQEEWEKLREEQISKTRKGGDEEEEDEDEQKFPEDLGLRLDTLKENEGEDDREEGDDEEEEFPTNFSSQKNEEEDEDQSVSASQSGGDSSRGGSSIHRLQMVLDEELPQCHSRERTDEFAIRFCQFNGKAARRRLVKALLAVPRQALDLIPQYSRLVATLDQVLKDIAPSLVEELRGEARWLIRKRTATHLIESKRKNVSFLGELIKFGVAPPVAAFGILRACFEDFAGNNVEMACTLLERCGRFLYRSRHTHMRLNACLEIMMRLKKAKNLDPKYEITIDNAYYQCKPPEDRVKRGAAAPLAPLQLWIHHLIKDHLSPSTVSGCLRSLRRLPWDSERKREEESCELQGEEADSMAKTTATATPPIPPTPTVDVEKEVLGSFIEIAQKKFTILGAAADVLCGLHKHHPSLTVKIVDAILEDITFACEYLGPCRDLQRRLGLAGFLGELYNCALVSSAIVFDTLHSILNIGHTISSSLRESLATTLAAAVESGEQQQQQSSSSSLSLLAPASWATHDPRVMHPCDPPGDCLRIRLIVQILEACTFQPKLAPRVAHFLTYFQRYVYCKQNLSPDTEFAILDLFDSMKKWVPFQQYSSWDEAQAAVEKLEEAEYLKKLEKTEKDNQRKALKEQQLRKESAFSEQEVEEEDDDDDDDSHLSFDDDDDDDDDDDENENEDDSIFGDFGENGDENEDGDGDSTGGESADSSSSDSDDDDDDDDDFSEESDEEDVHLLGQAIVPKKTEADNEFDRMFEKLMSDNLNKSKSSSHRSMRADNIAAPTLLGRITVKGLTRDMPLTGEEGISFKMLKRGAKGKVEGQALLIPAGTNLAAHQRRVTDKVSNEHELIKQRVLASSAAMDDASSRSGGSGAYQSLYNGGSGGGGSGIPSSLFEKRNAGPGSRRNTP